MYIAITLTIEFRFDPDKDRRLRSERGVGFFDAIEAIEAIEAGRIFLDFRHPDHARYPRQRMFVLDINGYAHCVPYVTDGPSIVLKTIYPNRKFKHLIEGGPDAR